jgi:murein tripeptide amidase MpaA
LVTIKKNCTKEEENNKNVILISGRVHPGETVGSFIVKGIIDRLVDNTNELK